MKVYKINNQKEFTRKLFLESVFDNFVVGECNFVKDYSVIIDGRTSESEDAVEESVTWDKVREIACHVIKGKELPKSFKIVLKLSKENTINTLKALEIEAPDGTGMFVNIRYNEGELSCTSGTSTTEFFLTKEMDKGWDAFVQKFLEKNSIEFEEN